MKTRTMNLSREQKAELKERVNDIDLEPIKFKLVKEYGWDVDYADRVEPVYKHYLYLNALHDKVVPTKAVDEMWHAHILDTHKYHEDCQTAFGEYAHHFPYFGMRGEEDAKSLTAAFGQTIAMFARDGIDLVQQSIPARASMSFTEANTSSMCSCNGQGGGGNCDGPAIDRARPGRDDLLALKSIKTAPMTDSAAASMCSCNGGGGGGNCDGNSVGQVRPGRSDLLALNA
jgi:hypothetical protein